MDLLHTLKGGEDFKGHKTQEEKPAKWYSSIQKTYFYTWICLALVRERRKFLWVHFIHLKEAETSMATKQ